MSIVALALQPRGLFVAALAFAAVPAFHAAAAQSDRAILAGTVRDHAGLGVPGVRIVATPADVMVITDSVGRFALRGLSAGSTRFEVRRIGFEPGEFSLDLKPGDSLYYDLRLEQAAVPVPGMETKALAPMDQLKTFYAHRASAGGGHFIVRADIEEKKPERLTDMLRSIPGIDLFSNPARQQKVRMARSNLGAFGDCPIEYWIDGVRAEGFSLDEMAPQDVEAMEIYAGPAALPPEYRTTHGTSGCGTIAIWTRLP
jgi:hypothetical protein